MIVFCVLTWSGDDDGLAGGVVGLSDVVEGHDPQLVLLPTLQSMQNRAPDVGGIDVVGLEPTAGAVLALDVFDPEVLVHAAVETGAPRQVDAVVGDVGHLEARGGVGAGLDVQHDPRPGRTLWIIELLFRKLLNSSEKF